MISRLLAPSPVGGRAVPSRSRFPSIRARQAKSRVGAQPTRTLENGTVAQVRGKYRPDRLRRFALLEPREDAKNKDKRSVGRHDEIGD